MVDADKTSIEKELRATQEYLSMLLQVTHEAIWDCNLVKGTVWWNSVYNEMFGERPATTSDSWDWWIERIHPDDRMRVSESLRDASESSAKESSSEWREEYRFRRSDGQYCYVADRAYIIRDANGKPERVVGAMQDMTEQKKQEEQREILESRILQTQKLESLGVLAGGIAHDFNNLLTAILGNSELALHELQKTSPATQYIERTKETVVQAADLCKQMLAYSGKGKFVVKSFSLNELVEDMIRLLQVSISKSAVLNLNLSDYVPPIEGDVVQVRQIVMNLVMNASEAIGEKSGLITITTGVMEASRAYLADSFLDENLPEGLYTYLEVSDTGCGMNDETIAKIFDPFFTTKFSGRGLGLAAVLGIVRGHHGALKVYSHPGDGTTIKVLFACTEQPVEAIGATENGSFAWQGTGTILVVDDEETVRNVAKRMLEQFGFTVLTASNGREAMEVFRSHDDEIRALLLDMTMPHLGGEETFRQLRQEAPGIKVLMMSGYNEQEVTSRFAGKGLAGFIQKPFGKRALAQKMQTVLGESRTAKNTILVIDDTLIVREAIKALLQSIEYEVVTAGTGQSGIEVLKEHVENTAAVLLDRRLPDMPAGDIFQQIRKYTTAPVILLTGHLTEEIAAEYKEMGFAATLAKPIPMETLLAVLQDITSPGL